MQFPLHPRVLRMSILVRPATVSDWQVLRDFNCELALETEDKRLDPETVSSGVRAVLADSRKGRYFVAVCDERVVGQLMHTYEWSDWRNGDIWWLQSVYVHPEYRQRGVFRKLFEHIQSAAQADRHVVGIRLYVEEHNSRATETYRRLGLQPAGYSVMEQMIRRAV